MNATDTVGSSISVAAVRCYLLGRVAECNIIPRPALVTPVSHKTFDCRVIGALHEVPETNLTLFLSEGKFTSNPHHYFQDVIESLLMFLGVRLLPRAPRAAMELPGFASRDPAAECPSYNVLKPCGIGAPNESALRTLLDGSSSYHTKDRGYGDGRVSTQAIFTPPIDGTSSRIRARQAISKHNACVSSEAVFRARIQVDGRCRYIGVVASLVVMPVGSAAGCDGYLVTQGMLSLSHMTMSEAGRPERDITLPPDTRLMRLPGVAGAEDQPGGNGDGTRSSVGPPAARRPLCDHFDGRPLC